MLKILIEAVTYNRASETAITHRTGRWLTDSVGLDTGRHSSREIRLRIKCCCIQQKRLYWSYQYKKTLLCLSLYYTQYQ